MCGIQLIEDEEYWFNPQSLTEPFIALKYEWTGFHYKIILFSSFSRLIMQGIKKKISEILWHTEGHFRTLDSN